MAKGKAARESLGSYIKRAMNGTSFLALEHVMHIVVLVAVTGFVAAGLNVLVRLLWTGQQADSFINTMVFAVPATQLVDTFTIVAALVVLCPLMVILDKRTRAERVKRAGFDKRLAYKAPLYAGLAIVWLVKLGAFIALVATALHWVVGLGRSGDIVVMHMYGAQFTPALVTMLVFGVAGWYLIRRTQQKDYGLRFNRIAALVGGVVAAALFATSVIQLQSPGAFNMTPEATDLPLYMRDQDLPL